MMKIITVLASLVLSSSAAEVSVYLGSGSKEGISHVILNSDTGALTGLRNVVQTSSPGSLAMSKDRNFLFSIGREKGVKEAFVASFAKNSDGSLTQLSRQSSMDLGACYVSLDHSSKVLLVANYGGGSVASYLVGEDGKLSPAVSHHKHQGSSIDPKRQKKPYAHSIYVSPDNRYVYAADLGADKVVVYALNAETGELKPSSEAKVPAGSGARHMKFSINADKLYVLNELTLTVSQFSRDANSGALTLEMTKPVTNGSIERMSASEITLSEDGTFLYAACRDLKNENRDRICVLKVEDLSILQEQPAGVSIPRHFAISPSGKWLLIAGQKGHKVVVLARDANTGKLSETPHSVEMNTPMWILFE